MWNDIFLKVEADGSEATFYELQEQTPDLHVLIVDDDEELRAILSFALVQAGYKVTMAKDGPTALNLVKEKQPDIVLLDLILPGMEGIEICWRIRQFSDVPILIMTVINHDSEKVWGLKAGADDYIIKPFSIRELLARIEAIRRRYEAIPRALGERSNIK
ncbi:MULTISPECIES: response regulator transcription factor [Aerosakkonema]|uniref:response regulator transcription factor n=1 Tax=Aerosakkonema TaxID=1246629 RepID=UPI0035B6EC15